MPKKRHSAGKIITRLREAGVLQSKEQMLSQACKSLGLTWQTYYRWRKEYSGR